LEGLINGALRRLEADDDKQRLWQNGDNSRGLLQGDKRVERAGREERKLIVKG